MKFVKVVNNYIQMKKTLLLKLGSIVKRLKKRLDYLPQKSERVLETVELDVFTMTYA